MQRALPAENHHSTSLVAFGAVVRTRFAKPNGKAAPPADEFAYRTPA